MKIWKKKKRCRNWMVYTIMFEYSQRAHTKYIPMHVRT